MDIGRISRKEVIVFFLMFTLFFIVPGISLESEGDVSTSMNVSNSGPILIKTLPNLTWKENENKTNVFDLDEYFLDPNGDPINFSSSNVSNVEVAIDNKSRVSFYPDLGFIGTRNVTFYATDGVKTGESNRVFLNIGTDKEAPKWSNMYKNREEIYQNDIVNFTTTWTDNVALEKYIFSIKQARGWQNHSVRYFSGQYNVSEASVKISAYGGSTVKWKFYAFDTSDNVNVTDVMSFNVTSERGEEEEEEEDITGEFLEELFEEKEEVRNYTIDIGSFKASLKQGSRTTRILRITNIGNVNLSFNFSILDLEEFVELGKEELFILPGRTKEVTLDIEAREQMSPGQYFGSLLLTAFQVNGSKMVPNTTDRREIPIVIDINEFEQEFTINVSIPSEYRDIEPGEVIGANITIKNIKDVKETNGDLYMAIKDLKGNVYDSKEEEVTFGRELRLGRKLKTPEDGLGEHIFYARVENEENSALDSEIFSLGYKSDFASILKISSVFILVAFLSLILIILIWKYRKEKDKEKTLRLYMMLSLLREAIEEENYEEAEELYVRIKSMYNESVPRKILEDKKKLRKEVKKLAKKMEKFDAEEEEKNEGKGGGGKGKKNKKSKKKKGGGEKGGKKKSKKEKKKEK